MVQPKGFEKPGEEQKVCLLKKSLYWLKQSSRQWNKKFHEHMETMKFQALTTMCTSRGNEN